MYQIYGYVRVSSKDQNEDRQLVALKDQNIPISKIFIDKQSGKDFRRPAYEKLMKRAAPGDLILVKSIDRLGRNYEEILEQWRIITKEKRVNIKIIDMPLLDTSNKHDLIGTFIADIVLQLLSFVAENERENIRQRQKEGIAAAKNRGVKFGRPMLEYPSDFGIIYQKWKENELSVWDAIQKLNLTKSTFYRMTKRYEEEEFPFLIK